MARKTQNPNPIIKMEVCPKCEVEITDLHASELHDAQGCVECENDGWLLLPTCETGLAILAQYPETRSYVEWGRSEWKRPWYAMISSWA